MYVWGSFVDSLGSSLLSFNGEVVGRVLGGNPDTALLFAAPGPALWIEDFAKDRPPTASELRRADLRIGSYMGFGGVEYRLPPSIPIFVERLESFPVHVAIDMGRGRTIKYEFERWKADSVQGMVYWNRPQGERR